MLTDLKCEGFLLFSLADFKMQNAKHPRRSGAIFRICNKNKWFFWYLTFVTLNTINNSSGFFRKPKQDQRQEKSGFVWIQARHSLWHRFTTPVDFLIWEISLACDLYRIVVTFSVFYLFDTRSAVWTEETRRSFEDNVTAVIAFAKLHGELPKQR